MDNKRYRINKKINQGPITTTYLGTQISLSRPVLVKRLNPQWIKEQDLLERFRREALICARLKHPNIVNIIDVDAAAENPFLIIEFMDGIDLGKFIQQFPVLPFPIILYITCEILEGLAYAHNHDVIHRDIKPSNIMIDRKGRVKISDFGLAKVSDLPEITLHGEVVGTPAYMSPEQARVSKYDLRTDLFSLGATIYEMADGASPFQGKNIIESIQKLVTFHPAPLHEKRDDIPAWFSEITSQMLAKKPAERPQTADEALALPEWQQTISRDDFLKFIAENVDMTAAQAITLYPAAEAAIQTNEAVTPQQIEQKSPFSFAISLTILFLLLSAIAAYYFSTESSPETLAENSPPVPADSSQNLTLSDSLVQETNNINSETVKVDSANLPKAESLLLATNNTPKIKADLPKTEKEANIKADSLTQEQKAVENDTISIGQTAAQPASLWIDCAPWGHVFLDGKQAGTTPLSAPLSLTPGRYQLAVKNPNFETWQKEIVLEAAQTERISVNFRAREGLLTVEVIPWAQVYINGKYYEDTPLDKPIALPVGKYKIELKNPAFETWTDSVLVFYGNVSEYRATLKRKKEKK